MLSRLAILLIPVLLFACGFEETASAPEGVDQDAVAVSENSAPLFDKMSVGGQQISNTDFLGDPVIVTFWATTCVPCRRELPMLQQLAKDHAADKLTVLTINTGEPDDLILEFLDEISVDLPVIVDQDGILASEFELLFLPMTYFIDGDWKLRYSTIGEPNEKQIEHGLGLILPAG